jgi:hypothetical protein
MRLGHERKTKCRPHEFRLQAVCIRFGVGRWASRGQAWFLVAQGMLQVEFGRQAVDRPTIPATSAPVVISTPLYIVCVLTSIKTR